MPHYRFLQEECVQLVMIFHCFTASINSQLPPLKFVPLSDLILFGFPCLAMKHLILSVLIKS